LPGGHSMSGWEILFPFHAAAPHWAWDPLPSKPQCCHRGMPAALLASFLVISQGSAIEAAAATHPADDSGVDLVFDCVGREATMRMALSLVAPGGAWCSWGWPTTSLLSPHRGRRPARSTSWVLSVL